MKVTLALTLIEQAVIIVVALTSLLVIVFFIVKRGFKSSNEAEEDINIDREFLVDSIITNSDNKAKSASITTPKTSKKFKNKYKYSRITKGDIKNYTGLYTNKLSEKILIDTILRLKDINSYRKITPESIYLSKSLADTSKKIKGVSTLALSKYFRNENISPNNVKLIEKFFDKNIKNTYIV